MQKVGEKGFIYLTGADRVIYAEDVPDKYGSYLKNMIAYLVDSLKLSEDEIKERSLIINGSEHDLGYYLHDFEDSDDKPVYLELIDNTENGEVEFTINVMSEDDTKKILRRLNPEFIDDKEVKEIVDQLNIS